MCCWRGQLLLYVMHVYIFLTVKDKFGYQTHGTEIFLLSPTKSQPILVE